MYIFCSPGGAGGYWPAGSHLQGKEAQGQETQPWSLQLVFKLYLLTHCSFGIDSWNSMIDFWIHIFSGWNLSLLIVISITNRSRSSLVSYLKQDISWLSPEVMLIFHPARPWGEVKINSNDTHFLTELTKGTKKQEFKKISVWNWMLLFSLNFELQSGKAAINMDIFIQKYLVWNNHAGYQGWDGVRPSKDRKVVQMSEQVENHLPTIFCKSIVSGEHWF